MSQKAQFIVKKIDYGAVKYISELQLSSHTPGFSILIKKNNEVIYEKSIGKNIISSNSHQRGLSSSSQFLCASLTKPVIYKFFTDLNKKKSKLIQASLDHFFSTYRKPYIKKITIQHLLTHTSGLSEYFGSYSSIPFHQLDKLNLKQISEYILKQKPMFKSGAKEVYSNSSFVILSRIIELIFKNNYELELEKYFKSLGTFKNTFFFMDKKKLNTAQYIKVGEQYIKAPWNRSFIGWGDGALISSPKEYLNIINPIEDKGILNYLFKVKSQFKYMLFT